MRLSRRTVLLTLVVALSVGLAEAACRFVLGLGDPPLTVRDPAIEYLFAPNKTYHRFGNTISYNAYSMRADDVTVEKTDKTQFRVLVLGDSVINGGALTDDASLATRLAQRELQTQLHCPVWVGNVSAGSWGPANMLAYVRRFGWFDADLAIFVFNSGDIVDIPEFPADLGPDFPENTPTLALEEFIVRYLPRYVATIWHSEGSRSAAPNFSGNDEEKLIEGGASLRALLAEARAHVPDVVVVHHRTLTELANASPDGVQHERLHGVKLDDEVHSSGVQNVDLASILPNAQRVDDLFRDNIHLSVVGQQRYAEIFVAIAAKAATRHQGCS